MADFKDISKKFVVETSSVLQKQHSVNKNGFMLCADIKKRLEN